MFILEGSIIARNEMLAALKKSVGMNPDVIWGEIGSIKYEASITDAHFCGDSEVRRIRSLLLDIVNDILYRAGKSRDLDAAIYSTPTGYGSAVLKIQSLVVSDKYGFGISDMFDSHLPDTSQAKWAWMFMRGEERVCIEPLSDFNDVTCGFYIEYDVIHEGYQYHGYCMVEVPKFRDYHQVDVFTELDMANLA